MYVRKSLQHDYVYSDLVYSYREDACFFKEADV